MSSHTVYEMKLPFQCFSLCSPAAAVITVGPISSTPVQMIPNVEHPSQIATGRNGEIIVASYTVHKVYVYNKDCELQCEFGGQGFLDGQFMCPQGIAVNRHNQILVTSINKIDLFTMEGKFINAVGQHGKGELEFNVPAGVAVGKNGKIYVVDSMNHRIQVLDSDLAHYKTFSKACSSLGSGHLSQPQAIAINSEGNVYVADTMSHAVQAFTPEGSFLLKFGKYGPATTPGAVCSPMALAIDRDDNVYIGSVTGTIGIFDKQGEFIRQFGSHGSELGQFNTIRGMHIDSKGYLYVSEWSVNRIQVFQGLPLTAEEEESIAAKEEEAKTGSSLIRPAYTIGPISSNPIKILPDIQKPNGLAEGLNGEVVISSEGSHKVYVYNESFKLKAEIGGKGDLDGWFSLPTGVAVDSENHIVVSSRNKLQWFTMDGKFVYATGSRGNGEMEFDRPGDIAIGQDKRIYVLDMNNNRVQIFNGDATYHNCFTFPKGDGIPDSLAINSEGNIYFTNRKQNCVQVFSPEGEFLFKFGKSGPVNTRGSLGSPMTIAIDNEDYVFVGNVTGIVTIFDKCGRFVRGFGGHGGEPGQFNFMKGMCVGRNGLLYISEYSANRVQIFEGLKPMQPSSTNHHQTNKVRMLSSRRPAYTVGPVSVTPVHVLTGIEEPLGIGCNQNGDIVMASKKKKLLIFSKHGFQLKQEISKIEFENSRDNDIVDPSGITFSEDGCILLTIRQQLLKLTTDGQVIASVGKRKQGRSGKGNLDLDSACGVAVGKGGRIYVADTGNRRVQIFNADLSYKGTCLSPNSKGDDNPKMVAVNSAGYVYVTDERHNSVQVFDFEGRFIFRFGKKETSTERGGLSSPVAIAIDQEDYVYVSSSNVTVSIFDKEGCFVRAFGSCGDEPGQFRAIKGMHVDENGHLYVSDYKSNRVQIFHGIKSQYLGEGDGRAVGAEEKATFDEALPLIGLLEVNEPYGVTEGWNGEIMVASYEEHNVCVYNEDYKLVAKFGGKGELDGWFDKPTDVAVDAENHIVVSSRNKLQWFTINGNLVHAVGSRGKDVMEFENADNVTIGKDGRIYVLEKVNKRVQILNGDATYHSSFKFNADQSFETIGVNSEGHIYLSDTANNCVQVFSSSGDLMFKFCENGYKTLVLPTAIAIDSGDNVYVGTISGSISMFDKGGHFIKAFRVSSSEPNQFHLIRGLHLGRKSGYLYVSESSHNRVQIFNVPQELKSKAAINDGGSLVTSPPALTLTCRPAYTIGPTSTNPIKILTGIKEPHGITTGMHGEIVVASNRENTLFVYSHDYHLLKQITEIDCGDPKQTKINRPAGLVFSRDGYLLISCQHQLLKITPDGRVVAKVGSSERGCSGKGDTELRDPNGVAVGKDGRIYIVDCGNHRVQIFDEHFVYYKTSSNPDAKERSGEYLECVAINSDGDFYVTDRRNCNIQVFNHDGKFMFVFGKKATPSKYQRGTLTYPHAIAIDHSDFVYVGGEDGIVSIFDRKGNFVRAFGGKGNEPGQFGLIWAMHIDHKGLLYVCEQTNNRVQIFQ